MDCIKSLNRRIRYTPSCYYCYGYFNPAIPLRQAVYFNDAQVLDRIATSNYNVAMVRKLSHTKRSQILNLLLEGSSMRSISRVTQISINSVAKLLELAGEACAEYHHQHVRGVSSQLIQCDEIWSFLYAKDKNVPKAVAAPEEAGSLWTWTAIDSVSKLIVSWHVSQSRDGQAAIAIMDDLRSRTKDKFQLTTDGLNSYPEAVEGAFGGNVDFAQLIKLYADAPREEARRYSPSECIGTRTNIVTGQPDSQFISTSTLSGITSQCG